MARKTKAARHRCNDNRANVHSPEDTAIISDIAWTRAKCRAIEFSVGGGFLLLAIMEVIFKW